MQHPSFSRKKAKLTVIFFFFANSTLPSVSLSLTLSSISPTLLLDQVLERKPRLSLLLPPLIASHL